MGAIRIDGTSYIFLGIRDQNVSKIENIQITPTRTIYVMTAGPMNLTVTFLSPIEVSYYSVISLLINAYYE